MEEWLVVSVSSSLDFEDLAFVERLVSVFKWVKFLSFKRSLTPQVSRDLSLYEFIYWGSLSMGILFLTTPFSSSSYLERYLKFLFYTRDSHL